MIGQTISHYAPKTHLLNESSTTRWVDRPVGSLRPLADKIFEKLSEVRNFLPQFFYGIENFRIPLERSGSGRDGI